MGVDVQHAITQVGDQIPQRLKNIFLVFGPVFLKPGFIVICFNAF
jgi:hypothetical protein